MANLFPGAIWRPQPGQETRPKRRKGRGVGLHVAVYIGPSIWDINRRTGNDAHLYVRKDGSVEQNIDLDLQAWAGADGNPTMIWVETEGGMGSSAQINAEPWTPQQFETLAQIAAYAHRTEGVPLQVMPDSRPASRGIGTHRLGVQHSRGVGAVPGWLVAGGERWTKHIGKECPGNAKVAQVPGIAARAQQIAGGAPATPIEEDDMFNDDDRRILRVIGEELRGGPKWEGWPGLGPDGARGSVVQGLVETLNNTRRIAGLEAAVTALSKTIAQQAGGEDVDVQALAAHLDATVRAAMADTVKVQVSVDADHDATA